MVLQCANCGANLQPSSAGAQFVTCHFCGQVTELEPPPPQEPPPPPEAPAVLIRFDRGPGFAVRPRRGGLRGLPALLFLGVLIFALHQLRAVHRTGARNLQQVLDTVLPTVLPEHLQWDSLHAPQRARINDDAVEDFVGVYRVLESTGDAQTRRYVGGYDGATLKRIWAAGPFGQPGDPGFVFAVAGRHVVVTDDRSNVHVLSLATGKEAATASLSDRAHSICPAPDADEVWIEVSDEQNVVLDLLSGKLRKAARPVYCKGARRTIEDLHCEATRFSETGATCRGVDQAFKAPHFQGDRMLIDGDATVVVGVKSPGSPTPTAVGYDPKTKRIIWQQAIPVSDPASLSGSLGLVDLGGGRLVAQLALRSGVRILSALDAKTGAAIWETEVPRSKEGSEAEVMTVTPTRVYLPHWTWLDVFDAPTGRVLGTIGQW